MINQPKTYQSLISPSKREGSLLHKQVEEAIRIAIEKGEFKPSERIPQERNLAGMFKVSRDTIRKAISELAETGHLKRVRGQGTYVNSITQSDEKIGVVEDFSNGAVIKVTPYTIHNFAINNMLTDLDDLFTNSLQFNRDDFYPELLDAYRIDGELLAIPAGFGVTVAYVNETLLQQNNIPIPKTGWTFDEFEELSVSFASFDRKGNQTRAFANFLPWPMCVWGMGGKVVNQERNQYLLDQPKAIAGLNFYKKIFKLNTGKGIKEDSPLDNFLNGKIAVLFSSRSSFNPIKQAPFNCRVILPPEGKQASNWVFGHGYGILKDGTDIAAEWKNLEQAILMEIQKCSGGNMPHCRPIIINDPLDIPLDVPVHAEALQSCHFTHLPKTHAPQNIITRMLELADENVPEFTEKKIIEIVKKINIELME